LFFSHPAFQPSTSQLRPDSRVRIRRGDPIPLDSRTLAAPSTKRPITCSGAKSPSHTRARRSALPLNPQLFPPPPCAHISPSTSSAPPSLPLPAAFVGAMDTDDFLPEGGKLPELKLGASLRSRSCSFPRISCMR
jgi:hypothetical protein